MSAPQTPRKSLNLFKDEVFGSLREIELNFKLRIEDLESKLKKDVDDFKMKINQITVDHKEMKELLIPQKVKIEKIVELENFKNKFNDMLITHEVRIKNNFDEITKSRLRYDKLISENLYVPGYIGNACQFKNLSDYISFNINEVSKLKLDKEQVKKDFKELKTRQDNMMKSMVTLNESSVQICNTYADGKNKEIKEILNRSLEQLNQKSFEMRTMIHQFVENAKKIEEKSKEELDNIIEIKNNINNELKNNSNEIKKFMDEITKKIKESNTDIINNKKKIESLTEQLKEVNKNLLNISTKIKNTNNTSNIFNNRSKINLTKSVSPTKDRRFKTLIDYKSNSPPKSGRKYNNDNKHRNKSEISLDSIITENSVLDDDNNKKTKDLQVNSDDNDNNDIIKLKEINNNIEDKMDLNTINNISDFNKPKIISDSLNNTNNNSINMKISSIQNSKNTIKNNDNNNILNRVKDIKDTNLPTIIKNREINSNNLLFEETRKSNDNMTLSTRLKNNKNSYNMNNLLKIKSTKIVFKLDDNVDSPFNNKDDYYNYNNYNNNINMKEKRNSIDKTKIKYTINNNNINSMTIPKKKVKFNHRKEILLKRGKDSHQQKDKEKQGLKLISLTLPKTEEENNKDKDKSAKDELSSTIDNYRVNAFTNIRNINENNIIINNNEEMLDFPKKSQAFGRTTYNFLTKNDVINHINANQNINNFELMNKKNKK